MRQWLTILLISLTLGLSGQNPRQSITWLRAEDITNTRYFIWRGDTIDFTRFVDSLYVSVTDTALFLATKNWVINNTVMMGDSINVYITPKQLRDSLGTLPGGHNPVTISQQGLNNGLSIDNDQILTIRAASTSQAGALTSNAYNIFNNKLNAVTHDNTLTGAGTVANPLKVDTSRIASKSWVLNFKFLTQEYRDYDSLYNTPFIPEIKNDPFGVDWQNDVDNGASRNAIYNAITGLGGGGGATNLSYSAYTDKGIVNSDTGTDAEIPAGSTVNASLMLPEDKEFLDTVEDSITAHRIKINSLKLVNIDSTNFSIDTSQVRNLKTFVVNNSPGGENIYNSDGEINEERIVEINDNLVFLVNEDGEFVLDSQNDDGGNYLSFNDYGTFLNTSYEDEYVILNSEFSVSTNNPIDMRVYEEDPLTQNYEEGSMGIMNIVEFNSSAYRNGINSTGRIIVADSTLKFLSIGENNIAYESLIKKDKVTNLFYNNYGYYLGKKWGTVQDTTGIKYININSNNFSDSTLVPKYYVDNLAFGNDLSNYVTRTELHDTANVVRSEIPTMLTQLDSTEFRITKSQITDLTVGSSKWDDDTYGINYQSGNVGVGGTSLSTYKLNVNGSFNASNINTMGTINGNGLSFSQGELVLEAKPNQSRNLWPIEGSIWMNSNDNKLYFTNDNTTYDLTAGGGGSSKWSDDTNGINYKSGNIGVGSDSESGYLFNSKTSTIGWVGKFENTRASTGHGLQIIMNNTSSSYYALQLAAGGSAIFNFSNSGALRMPKYGKGNIVGTPARYLAVDSSGNVIEASGGSSLWSNDTYGITYTGNVGIGGASSAAEKLRVTHNSTNFAVDVYNSSSTGKGLQVRAGGTNHSILDLANYTGTSRFSFSSNGKAKFSSYGQGNITGTVSKYLAVDSSGNIIEADGTGGGGGGGVSSVAFSSSDFSVSGSPITSSGTITANLQGTAITNKTEIAKGSVSKDDQLLVSKSGNLRRTAIDAIETYLNRKAKLSDNAVTFNYETVKKAELKITNNNNSFSITNLPDGGEGQIDIESTGNFTFNFSVSSPITTKIKMGENDNIKPSGRSTVVYWRTGTVLYYGFIWENDEQGEALNCPSPLINTVSSTGEFQMAHATFVDKDNGILYVGERVSGSAVARILKYDLSTLNMIDYYETGAGNSVESLVYHNGYVYASQIYDTGVSNVVRILRINSTTMSGANTYDYPTLLSGISFPLGTDGTYLYGATYNSSSKFFKIKLSDMSLVTTKDWTNGERAHALRMNTRTGHMYVTDIPYSQGDDVYFAKVSLSDLSYTDVNIGAYVRKATDDFAMIDIGTEVYCYVGSEYIYGSGHNAGYGAVQVKTSDLSLTGMSLKTTYGLAEFGNYVYSVTIDGNVQIFKHTNLGEIATCSLGGTYKGNEIIFDNSYGYVTNFNNYNKSDGKVIKINPT